MTSADKQEIRFEGKDVIVLDKWKVKVGARIGQSGHLLFTYRKCSDSSLEPTGDTLRYKSKKVGIIVNALMKKEGEVVLPNDVLIEFTDCLHNTVMKDLCADCGANINNLDDSQRRRIAESTSISMVHSVPELRVSKERAETLGRADELRLLKDRKLVLLVDLDQTLIHSTNHNVPQDMPDVHHFQLYGPHTQWYHTKLRPHTMDFLNSMSKIFELHICTFGARRYAHSIAHLMDPKEQYFPKDRILSRDECLDTNLKTGNMKSLFPCGDSMVCIIDDREDVWNFAPNLIAVKPYLCFKDTGDINAPEKALNYAFGAPEEDLANKTVLLDEFTKIEEKQDNKNEENKYIDSSKINEPSKQSTESTDHNVEQKSEHLIEEEKDVNTTEIEEIVKETEKIDVQEAEEKSNSKDNSSLKANQNESNYSSTETSPQASPQSKETESSDSSGSDSVDKSQVIEKSKTPEPKEETPKKENLLEDNDDYLLYLKEILTRIHSEYYKEYDEKMKYKSDGEEIKIPDLKLVISRVRKSVLRGVNIVFSGVIPTNMAPEKNKLYNMAKSLGANVTNELVVNGSPKTTHLVAAKWGTVKVNKAVKAKNIWLVNPNWLICCGERWERVEERLFPLDKEVLASEREKSVIQRAHDTRLNVLPSRSTVTAKPQTQASYAIYDPKTGKRVRPQSEAQSTSQETEPRAQSSGANQRLLEESRDMQPHNMLEFSPLSAFSKNDLNSMGKEVDDACSEGDELSTGNTDSEADSEIDVGNDPNNKCDKRQINSSSDESDNDGEFPKGWSKNKKSKADDHRQPLDEVNDSTRDSCDLDNRRTIGEEDYESTENESIGSVDEEMALAIEREFLS